MRLFRCIILDRVLWYLIGPQITCSAVTDSQIIMRWLANLSLCLVRKEVVRLCYPLCGCRALHPVHTTGRIPTNTIVFTHLVAPTKTDRKCYSFNCIIYLITTTMLYLIFWTIICEHLRHPIFHLGMFHHHQSVEKMIHLCVCLNSTAK